MQRRSLIKSMMLLSGGLIALPSWANNWSFEKIGFIPEIFPAAYEKLLAEIVATIIPATDTPGAKELGVDVLIRKILADCYEKEVQDNFAKGLQEVDAVSKKMNGKPFVQAGGQQRLEVLKQMEKQEQPPEQTVRSQTPPTPSFFRLVKELTILGYTNSEYVMTKLTGYVAVPGHYYGNTPYTSKKSS
jgi:hypothetical protein